MVKREWEMIGVLAKGAVWLAAGLKARLLRLCPKVCITQKPGRSDGTDMVSNYTSAKRMTNVHSKLCGEPPSRFVTTGTCIQLRGRRPESESGKGNFIIFIPCETSLLKVALHFTETLDWYL